MDSNDDESMHILGSYYGYFASHIATQYHLNRTLNIRKKIVCKIRKSLLQEFIKYYSCLSSDIRIILCIK